MSDRLKILTLGGVRILLNDAPVTTLITRKVEALLIYLACNPGEQQRDVLAEMLWDDLPTERAAGNFRNVLSNLRQNLDPFLCITRQTVAINPEAPLWLDVAALDAALAEGEAHWKQYGTFSRPMAAQLDEAIGWYRGYFLEGFYLRDSRGFEGWSMLEAERVRAGLIDAILRLAQAATRRGDHADAARYANRLLILDSLNEEAHRLLMSSLALGGQRAAALTQYQTCRKLLEEELAVEPEEETEALFRAIRDGRYTVAAPAPPTASHLPPDPTPFVPRPRLMGEITRIFASPDCRLLTLVGVGGAGKTRLAVELARQHQSAFADGVHFVNLAGLDSPEMLSGAIASVLNYTPASGQSLDRGLIAHLRTRELLLILDNFEDVLPAAEYVGELLRGSAALRLIVTTRERLNLQQEWAITVGGMETETGEGHDSAAQLFAGRAKRARPDFDAMAEAGAVRELCDLLGGLPLAIELAAAWLRAMTVRDILDAVRQNLDILSTSLRDVPARHRSMRAVFESTWTMLSPDECAALMGLSVFHGGCTPGAAAIVAGATPFTLTTLADRALLHLTEDRYQLHALLRQFAAEKLAADPVMRAHFTQRHCDYFADFVKAREARANFTLRDSAFAELAREIDNILAAWQIALEGGDPARIDRFLRPLYHFYQARDYRAGERVFRAALDHLAGTSDLDSRPAEGDSPSPIVARAGLFLGLCLQHQNRYDEAQALLAHVRPVLEAGGMRWELERVDLFEAVSRFIHSDFAGAVAIYEALLREPLEPADLIFVLMRMAEAVQAMGDYQRALGYLQESEALLEQHMGEMMRGAYLIVRGGLEQELGYYAESEAHFHEALTLAAAQDLPLRQCSALINLGAIHLERGEPGLALGYLRQCLAIALMIGSRFSTAATYIQIGRAHEVAGDIVQAGLNLGHGLRIAREIGTEWLQAFALRYLSRVSLTMGQTIEAGLHLDAALALLAETRPRPLLLDIVLGYAELAAATGRLEEALRFGTLVAHAAGRTFDTGQRAEALVARLREDSAAAVDAQPIPSFESTIGLLFARLSGQPETGPIPLAG